MANNGHICSNIHTSPHSSATVFSRLLVGNLGHDSNIHCRIDFFLGFSKIPLNLGGVVMSCNRRCGAIHRYRHHNARITKGIFQSAKSNIHANSTINGTRMTNVAVRSQVFPGSGSGIGSTKESGSASLATTDQIHPPCP